MVRSSCKFLLFGAMVAVVLAIATPQANACWGRGYYSPACYSPCYTSCYTSCYTPCCYTSCYTPCCTAGCYSYCDPCGGWYLGWRPGPARRLLLGRYRWYYAGGCGWSCCYPTSCCYDVCCNDVPVCGAASPAIPAAAPATDVTPTPVEKPVTEASPSDAVPALPADPAPTLPPLDLDTEPAITPVIPSDEPDMPAIPESSEIPTAANSGLLTVWVPYDAKVTVNGLVTKSTGSRRRFVSYGLKPGFTYTYVVRAEIVRDGRVIEDSRTITLTTGQRTAVAFGFNTITNEALAAR